jgi:orotate phosphoribosyltransferase
MTASDDLLRYIARYAYQYRPEKPFVLVSGATSDEYLDCKLALSQPGAMQALGQVFLERLEPRVTAIGGLTMGSDPIAISTAYASAASERPVRWFTVRKESKSHGQMKLIEGSVAPGEHVAVVDDVVTSGGSTIKAIEACRAGELVIAQVIVLVDRQQAGGMDNVRKAAGDGIDVSAIFTREQIKKEWLAQNSNR